MSVLAQSAMGQAPAGATITVDGDNVVPKVHAVIEKMAGFAHLVRSGQWKGHTGKRIRNVVNIGIGGSDLGPVTGYEALRAYSDRALTVRVVSNVDATDVAESTRDLVRPRSAAERAGCDGIQRARAAGADAALTVRTAVELVQPLPGDPLRARRQMPGGRRPGP